MSKKKKVYLIIILSILDLIISATTYLKIFFPNIDLDEMMFCVNVGLANSDFTPLFDAIKKTLPFFIILFILLYFLFTKWTFKNHKKRYIILLSILSFILALYNCNVFTYAYYKLSDSSFIEKNYVDPRNINIEFNKKKNLVFIILESFESTLMDKSNGGSWKYNLLPEVSLLNQKDYSTTFTNQDDLLGYKMIKGAAYTTASLITNNTAVPFKYKVTKKLDSKNFMNGAYTLGDLLKDNGYHNELISSATTSFGGVHDFFSIHGDYEIIDINNLNKYGYKTKKTDFIDWGFNDNYLFETAKKRLDYLSKQDKPFNLTLLGIDTHFPRGYKSNYTINKYKEQYANVYATESILLANFINYLSEQDYFKDTVIVIIGDHESMQEDFFKDVDSNKRYVNEIYINAVKPQNNKKRKYTALDTYPSILGAMGVKIEGNKIGLGTNLFSDEETLAEKYNYKELEKKLLVGSKFYSKNIYK